MAHEFTADDLDILYQLLDKTKKIQVGIADYMPYGGSPEPPSLRDNLNFLDQFANHFSQRLDPNALGMLVTPEYYVANKAAVPSSYYSTYPTQKEIKQQISQISQTYPNIIFNTAGLYESPIRTREKLNKVQQEFEELQQKNPQLKVGSKDPRITRMSTPSNFMKFSANDPTELGKLAGAETSPPFNPEAIAKVKNQSQYHWKGHKLGSYRKSSEFNELSPFAASNANARALLYSPGNRKIKLTIPHHLDPKEGPRKIHSEIMDTLTNMIHPEICFDRTAGATPCQDKNMYILQSERVNLPPTPPLPLSIYADTHSLSQYNPLQNNFGAYNPAGGNTTVPNFGFWPVVKQYSPSSNSSHSSSAPPQGATRVPLLNYTHNPNNTHHGFIFAPTELG